MVNFTIDQIRGLMDVKKNIRNISVIAHVDHGKSTLSDSLIAAAGIISAGKAGDMRFMDNRADEQERGITIKSTAVSLYYKLPLEVVNEIPEESDEDPLLKSESYARRTMAAIAAEKKEREAELGYGDSPAEDAGEEAPAAEEAAEEAPAEEKREKTKAELEAEAAAAYEAELLAKQGIVLDGKNDFLINLIDSPGHVDFSSEVTAALRVTDGALVVVDCVEGVAVQTETVLRQAISERIRPVLFVNKLDRVLLELHEDLEVAYQNFVRAIESVNVIIDTYADELLGDVMVDPGKGTVGFGSGLHGWGFTLASFARQYAGKFGVKVDQMMRLLWGDNFINPKTGKWSKSRMDGKTALPRGFCQFILSPIQKLSESVMNNDKDGYTKLVEKLGVKLEPEDWDLQGKILLRKIMQKWLPAADTLLGMIVIHLPSPLKAQKYRIDNLYTGALDDEAAMSIRQCNANGPLMMFVSKMVPTNDKGRFYAFGRIFSGTVRTNQVVNIMGPEYKKGSKADWFPKKKIQRTVLMMGRFVEQIADCPAGNICGLVGVDTFLLKSGTISTSDSAEPFHAMRFSVSPVVRVAVTCKDASDLPKLVEGLRRLAKSDPLVHCSQTKTGEHIVAGAGELHLEICLNDLANDFMKGAPIKIADPVVTFCETLTKPSSQTVIAKSSNKHNRLYMTGQPLSEDLCKKIESGDIEIETKDTKKRIKILVDEFGWDKGDATKIWAFGLPTDGQCNVFVDCTKGAAFLGEIKDSVTSAFQQVSLGGVLADEPMRGCRFNLNDLVLHADAVHRGHGQIMPAAKQGCGGVQIVSGPRLLEPMYLVDITVPEANISGVFNTLQMRRGRVVPEEDGQSGPLAKIKAYLPVLESFGFTQLLRQNTSGKAFPQMIFDHWELVGGEESEDDIYNDPKSKTRELIMQIRKRKGMKEELPDLKDYHDKL